MNALDAYLKRNGYAYFGMVLAFTVSGFALIVMNKGWETALNSVVFGSASFAVLWLFGFRFPGDRLRPGRRPLAMLGLFGTVLALALALLAFGPLSNPRPDWPHILDLNLLYVPFMLWLFEPRIEAQQ